MANADVTFGVRWNGYVFGIVYLVFYRMICERWRKTPWPVCIVAHPREDKSVYKTAFQKILGELERWELPMLAQIGLDHFPGLETKFLEVYPSGQVSHGIGHLLKILRSNQRRSRRRGTPGLSPNGSHSIATVCNFVHRSSTLPTRVMFHVFWEVTGARINHVWGDGKWWMYFRRIYLRTKA